MLSALRFEREALFALDQTQLPEREVFLELRSAREVADAIRRLSIRGAPMIGVAAGYGVALACAAGESAADACDLLVAARPTAVNLAHAARRVRDAAVASGPEAALVEAAAIEAEEVAASDASAAYGADLLAGVKRVMTHCNTGALAAPGRGCALSVVAELASRGSLERVTATETRPLLQGARLTVYELAKLGIPHELIVDGAAAGLIARGHVEAVIVGCDRVAANGDVANKVGTYALALAAREAGIPFVVVGPTSTIDVSCLSGSEIEIEERAADEVRSFRGVPTCSVDTACVNPAFDVTPARLVTALVTERGIARPVSGGTIAALLP
jgi:methylthioribose-1-phosphate isomerase